MVVEIKNIKYKTDLVWIFFLLILTFTSDSSLKTSVGIVIIVIFVVTREIKIHIDNSRDK